MKICISCSQNTGFIPLDKWEYKVSSPIKKYKIQKNKKAIYIWISSMGRLIPQLDNLKLYIRPYYDLFITKTIYLFFIPTLPFTSLIFLLKQMLLSVK